jgi:quaternary ammonium compound-resistance protein SugE
MSYWILLIVAGLLETAWAIGLKYTDGFTRFWPSVWTLLLIAGSMLLLSLAARGIPIGTAYSVWVGIGALGAVLLGMILFGEPVSPARLAFVVLLLVSLIGLKWTSSPMADVPVRVVEARAAGD